MRVARSLERDYVRMKKTDQDNRELLDKLYKKR